MPVSPIALPQPFNSQIVFAVVVDPNGYPIGTIATSDGAQFGSISGESQFLYTSGGPPLASGDPSLLTFDRQRGYLGKYMHSDFPTVTVAGDASLVFPAAPKSLMPGAAILLQGGPYFEFVYVSTSYVPSPTTTTIPLQNPVVASGHNIASWDIFSPAGPANLPFTGTGVGMQAQALVAETYGDFLTAASAAYQDGTLVNTIQQTVPAAYSGGTTADRLRTPNVTKSFNAQAVTISSANTPTLIWTPTSGKKFRLMGYWFSTTNSAGLLFHDLVASGGTGLLGIPSPVHAAGAVIQSPPLGNGVISAVANNKLFIDATAATTLTGFVYGTEE